ncbi:MAG TPA: winged helix-turn-helix transcriptional regulator [Vicinamibacterales bacterium]|jgi:DNA-binding MarR family transcriptional regulator|nr:winged helix-turn-helix transcriptional regulator [Vicinamibacterales bacterium]
MDVESRRDLQLLRTLEQESSITQRTLASRLGIALGLTNLYLRRLIRKGYVKCVTASPNRLVYSLTPKGVARKARLTYEFMKYSLDFYRDARQHLRGSLAAAVAQQNRVAIYGTGDAAELVFLLLREMGLELVAVFGPEADGRFLGLPVLGIADHACVAYDVLIVAVLDRPAGTARLLRHHGVPQAKVLMVRPDHA